MSRSSTETRAEPESTPRGGLVLAVPRAHAGADGDREADFINIVAWRQLASTVAEHLTKGRLVGVAGRLRISDFEGQDGTRRTTTEVVADQGVFLDAPRRPAKLDNAESWGPPYAQAPTGKRSSTGEDDCHHGRKAP